MADTPKTDLSPDVARSLEAFLGAVRLKAVALIRDGDPMHGIRGGDVEGNLVQIATYAAASYAQLMGEQHDKKSWWRRGT
jgi:hypothetical protein